MGIPLAGDREYANMSIKYDLAIIGGGLAGLSLSIQLARKGFRICLFEKETYPFHKVCGEYISMESWDFLTRLGLPLEKWELPKIHRLYVTASDGKSIKSGLPLGGFGISRYKLDAALADIAKKAGVEIHENTKVYGTHFEDGFHRIQTSGGLFIAKVTAACYGKKSNLDVKWKRPFIKHDRVQNYVGVKYHIRADLPRHEIALHNFSGGYCGVSEIEDGHYCLCYLTTSENLKNNHQSIPAMEEKILKRNPALRHLLDNMDILYDQPVTIAQISFAKKTQIENHIIFIGDAAGMIAPLCGNGMSMALHASKIAAEAIQPFFENHISREEMEKSYQEKWNRQFAKRLRTGRLIQHFFGKAFLSILLIRIMKPFPFVIRALIRQTHGEKF